MQSGGQSRMQLFKATGGGLTQLPFEFGKGQLDGIEIRAVRRQIAHSGAASRQQLSNTLNFVRGQIVQNDRVARSQLRTKHALQIDRKNFRIDWTVDHKRCFNALMAQSSNECCALPVTVWDGAEATPTNGTTPIAAGHLRVHRRLVNKHKLVNIPAGLLLTPKPPRRAHIRPILLGGARRFFYNSDPVASSAATTR